MFLIKYDGRKLYIYIYIYIVLEIPIGLSLVDGAYNTPTAYSVER